MSMLIIGKLVLDRKMVPPHNPKRTAVAVRVISTPGMASPGSTFHYEKTFLPAEPLPIFIH
jgi:hypothetical protein